MIKNKNLGKGFKIIGWLALLAGIGFLIYDGIIHNYIWCTLGKIRIASSDGIESGWVAYTHSLAPAVLLCAFGLSLICAGSALNTVWQSSSFSNEAFIKKIGSLEETYIKNTKNQNQTLSKLVDINIELTKKLDSAMTAIAQLQISYTELQNNYTELLSTTADLKKAGIKKVTKIRLNETKTETKKTKKQQ